MPASGHGEESSKRNQFLQDGLSPSDAADVLRLFNERISYDNTRAELRFGTHGRSETVIVLEALKALLGRDSLSYGVDVGVLTVSHDVAVAAATAMSSRSITFKGQETLPGDGWRTRERPGILGRLFSREGLRDETNVKTR